MSLKIQDSDYQENLKLRQNLFGDLDVGTSLSSQIEDLKRMGIPEKLFNWYSVIGQMIKMVETEPECMSNYFYLPAQLFRVPEIRPWAIFREADEKTGLTYLKNNLLIVKNILRYLQSGSTIHLRFLDALLAGHARTILKIVKLIDLFLISSKKTGIEHYRSPKKDPDMPQLLFSLTSTYDLRTELLKFCPSGTPTYEAYVLAIDPIKMRSIEYLMNPDNWCPKRKGLHFQMEVRALDAAKTLAERGRLGINGLLEPLSLLIGVRGNTAVGKSSLVGNVFGSINPDHSKASLKKQDGLRLLNKQVHDEGKVLFRRLMQHIIPTQLNYILDTRLCSLGDVKEMLIEPAKKKRVKALLYDMETPLSCSLLRVLLRPIDGEDPCPSLQPIVDGFMEIRSERMRLIQCIIKEDTIKEYTLFFKGKRVACKEGKDLRIYNIPAFYKSCRVPSQKEITKAIDKKITAQVLRKAVKNRVIPQEKKKRLKYWIGVSLGEAVERHANGEN